jgi:hypothetical protein
MTDAFDEEMQEDREPPTDPSERNFLDGLRQKPVLLVIAIIAAVGGLGLIILFAILLLRSDEETPPATQVAGPELDADTFAFQSISESGTISVTLETPIFLTVGGEEFSVDVELLTDGNPWTPAPANETNVVWAYGTIINYVFALSDSGDNRSLLEGLEVGDELIISNRSGRDVFFQVTSREQVDVDDREIFAQRSPGVTVILLEENSDGQRLMVQGRYVVPDVLEDSGPVGRVVDMGSTAQLEDLQFTVSGVSQLFDRPEAPTGFAFFLVDFQVQNVGDSVVDPSILSMSIADDMGNVYAPSPSAASLGNYPPLTGQVGPGQSLQATAGYQLPIGLASPFLRWRVALSATGSQMEVNIPFRTGESGQSLASIILDQAEVSLDGTSVLLTGQIVNLSDQPVIVDVTDITLQSNGTVYLMLSTNPAFPWVINPGLTLPYEVTFQRPAGASATFTVLSQAFQLNGLR